MPEDRSNYAALRPCGCICMAVSMDCPDAKKEVASAMRKNLLIDRMTTNEVRTGKWFCETCNPKMAKKLAEKESANV